MENKESFGIIYKASFPNGKVYVGQTAFHRAIKKYGVDSIAWKIIDTAQSIEELNEREIHWIKALNSFAPNKHGYNMTLGGGGSTGCVPSEETRAKMSIARLGNTNALGYKHSAETCAKDSAGQIKRQAREHAKVFESSQCQIM
jgi:hypothetical protein